MCASFAKNGAKCPAGMPRARDSTGSMRSPTPSSVLKYVTIAARIRSCPSGHWLRPRSGVPATTSG